MDKKQYKKTEQFMLEHMSDSAHDCQHVYRVLYMALDIARTEKADYEILITSCLLHDVGREKQFRDPSLCHAAEGGKMAFDFLFDNGWDVSRASHVRDCITSHRYRSDCLPATIEAKILFDADKLDATGAMGIARTILYNGQVNESLYSVDEKGGVLDGNEKEPFSFFQEYQFKLKNLYDKFHTRRGKEIAKLRQASAVAFYESIFDEVSSSYEAGEKQLTQILFE